MSFFGNATFSPILSTISILVIVLKSLLHHFCYILQENNEMSRSFFQKRQKTQGVDKLKLNYKFIIFCTFFLLISPHMAEQTGPHYPHEQLFPLPRRMKYTGIFRQASYI